MIVVLVALGAFLAFFSTFNTAISRQQSTCRLKNWGVWVPDAQSGDQAYIVVNCQLISSKIIQLPQPSGWTPPNVDSEINIEIVNYRLSGTAYYVK